MQNLGPLYSISCLRYESKHFFKLLTIIQNYKNLPYSLANKHQLFLCHQMLDIYGNPAKNFVYSGDEVGEGCTIQVSAASHADIYNLFVNNLGLRHSYNVYDSPHVNIHGIMYRTDSVLLLSVKDFDDSHFGIISKIYVRDDVKYFLVQLLNTEEYLWHYHSYHSYLIEETNDLKLIKWNNLKYKFLTKLFKLENNRCVVMNKYGTLSRNYF